MGFDITKVLVSQAAVVGIGFLWFRFNETVFYAVRDIIVKTNNEMQDPPVKPKRKIREQIENIYSLIEQVLEDEQEMLKAVQDGEAVQDVQELKNKIIEQTKNICSKGKKLVEDCEGVQLENEIEGKIKRIKYFCSESKKNVRRVERFARERHQQELLTRLRERKHLVDEKIRLFEKCLK